MSVSLWSIAKIAHGAHLDASTRMIDNNDY